jgi:hypothetical protein
MSLLLRATNATGVDTIDPGSAHPRRTLLNSKYFIIGLMKFAGKNAEFLFIDHLLAVRTPSL